MICRSKRESLNLPHEVWLYTIAIWAFFSYGKAFPDVTPPSWIEVEVVPRPCHCLVYDKWCKSAFSEVWLRNPVPCFTRFLHHSIGHIKEEEKSNKHRFHEGSWLGRNLPPDRKISPLPLSKKLSKKTSSSKDASRRTINTQQNKTGWDLQHYYYYETFNIIIIMSPIATGRQQGRIRKRRMRSWCIINIIMWSRMLALHVCGCVLDRVETHWCRPMWQ